MRHDDLTLDLSFLLALLDDARDIAGRLEGTPTGIDTVIGEERRSNRHLAALSNDLRRLADRLRGAASEADVEYWRLKGHLDPRLDRD